MIKNRISLFVSTFLIISFFFLALPENGYSGMPINVGCCIGADECLGCGSSDCAITRNECDDIINTALWVPDFVCIQGVGCQDLPEELGCCVISEGECQNEQTIEQCNGEGAAWFLQTDCSELLQCPQAVVSAVPTLNEWGLIAMAGILGIVGFLVIRRRKVSA